MFTPNSNTTRDGTSGLVAQLLSLDDDGRVRVLLSLLGAPTIVRASTLGLLPAA
jgi:hypothetical protein